ncbi:uncharacterized protein LOC109711159 [Ananas comosus]|uniref:Uncharacterized protein LOC109711159 n=1 Tax=Ananas comosus TaxID=4615 RepID=A0A199V0V5_ANACO|nr:uncharacterized protein LOC109711159 [Ananas comosus]OAY70707.1 hypothetical protein ACMD2_10529 [Ananas comosus]
MATFLESIQKRRFFPSMPLKDDLPISQGAQKDTHLIGLRKRISSFSVKIQPISSASTEWAFRRSKSMPSVLGGFGFGFTAAPIRRWWDLGWRWILSRKPAFAGDLEMNEEETAVLGRQSKGSLRHIFYKLRSEVRKLVGSDKLPTTQKFRYDAINYVQNFDNAKQLEQ